MKYMKVRYNFNEFVIWDDEEKEEYYCSRGGAVGFFFTFAARQKYMLRTTNEVFGPMPLTHVSKKRKREENELKTRDTMEDLGLDAELAFYVFEKAGLV